MRTRILIVGAAVSMLALLAGCSSAGSQSSSTASEASPATSGSRNAAGSDAHSIEQEIGRVTAVTDATFQSEVLDSPVPSVVYFAAPWCNSCGNQIPLMQEATVFIPGEVHFVTVDAPANPVITQQYWPKQIPSYVLMKDGQVTATKTGSFLSTKSLVDWVKTSL